MGGPTPKPIVQPLNLPVHSSTKLLPPGQSMTSKTKPTSENSGRVTSATKDNTYKLFEENLPENCKFINETRDQLPRDPVKLIKLKLLKEKKEKNLKKEIERLSDMNRSTKYKNQVEPMKKNLIYLERTIQEKRNMLQNIREEYHRVSTSNVQNGILN